MAKHTIYKLYAELDNYKPKMWRVFEIDSKITLAKLGYILMTLFEMKAEHMYYIKHNTTVAFPSILFINGVISAIPYKITSKNNPNVVEGILKVSIKDDGTIKMKSL